MKLSLLFVALVLLALVPAVVLAEKPADEKADRAALARNNNQFAVELYGRLREKDGNLFFSPYSISTALGMTHAGARGETAEEMAKTLHFNLPAERQNAAFAGLIKEINGGGEKKGYQLSTANALWTQKDYPFAADYLKLVKDNFQAEATDLDFAKDTEKSRKTINAWVEKQTKEKIKDLLPENSLTANTRLVLTNAIYFKGDWFSQFKKDQTKTMTFRAGDDKIDAAFMSQTQRFGYAEDDRVQILEMPYVGKELSMVVLLPKKADGLADLEKALTIDRLNKWLDGLHETKVETTVPKFKTTVEFELSQTLSEMGMPIAFTQRADFSGMNGGKGSLQISKVVHKAFVDVNEEGTEAAAATGVVVETKSVQVVPVFRADHPFVFLIRDKRSGSVLFMGRIVNPTK
jgi:serpin B